MKRVLLAAVRFYQRAISPAFPPRCRFQPTCSAYALEAIELHGAGRGTWLAVRRILKCAPWHPGGVDLVPDPSAARAPRGTGDDGHSSSSRADRPNRAMPALQGAQQEESPVA